MKTLILLAILAVTLTACQSAPISAEKQLKLQQDTDSCFMDKKFIQCLKAKGWLQDIEDAR